MAFSLTKSKASKLPQSDDTQSIPVVALREGVVFPNTEAHLTFGRPKSNSAIEAAIASDKKVVLVAQKTPTNSPDTEDLYQVGTLCTIE